MRNTSSSTKTALRNWVYLAYRVTSPEPPPLAGLTCVKFRGQNGRFSLCRRNGLATVEARQVAATLPAKRSGLRATPGSLRETRENGRWRRVAALRDRLACLRH